MVFSALSSVIREKSLVAKELRFQLRKDKKPLVGLVTRVAPNPRIYSFTSVNERTHYYIKWIGDGPGSRYGRSFHKLDGYFLRNDLKFVKKGDFK